MGETYKERMNQLKYMRENKNSYLTPLNPNRVTEEEFNKRIKLLKDGE